VLLLDGADGMLISLTKVHMSVHHLISDNGG